MSDQELKPVAHAYVVEGECEQIEWGTDVMLPDDPSLVMLYDRAASHSQEAEPIAVKPLEWRDSYGVWRAETPFGDYIVTGKILRVAAVSMAFEQVCDDPKAAAQADYEKRIRSALSKSEGKTK